MSNYLIEFQYAYEAPLPVSEAQITTWVNAVLEKHLPRCELTLRFVDDQEMCELNTTYRQKESTTNVLAFPCDIPDIVAKQMEYPLLGDVIISPTVLAAESQTKGIELEAHWAHIVMHGVLHLLGYDHIKEDEAKRMEIQEIALLAAFQFSNPYDEKEEINLE